MKNIILNAMAKVRRAIYKILYIFDQLISHSSPDVIILCYHAIGKDDWRFSLDRAMFMRQMNYLLEERRPIGASDLQAYLNGEKEIFKPSFLLCFDDGYRDILQVRDFLQKKEIQPLLFVLSVPQEADRSELGTSRDFLCHEEISSLQKSGWSIGSHGATHRDFFTLDDAGRRREIVQSRMTLQSELGFPIDYFAYPRGRYDEKIAKEAATAGYTMAFTMDDAIINSRINRYAIPRIGVDRTHSFSEFRTIYSRSAIQWRRWVKGGVFFKFFNGTKK